jgi:hypothetical protein
MPIDAATPVPDTTQSPNGPIDSSLRKPKSRSYVLYDINNAVRFISNPSIHLYLRAIRLYELYVAIHFPVAVKLDDDEKCKASTGFRIAVRRRYLTHARIFSATALMAELTRVEPGPNKLVLRKLAFRKTINRDYFRVYEQFAADGGWAALPDLPRRQQFTSMMRRRRKNMEVAAVPLDISLRLKKSQLKPTKELGGFTSAMRVWSENCNLQKSLRIFKSKSTILRHWRTFKEVSIFGYLMDFQDCSFHGNLNLGKKEFAQNLLDAAENIERIRRFFALYNVIQSRLSKKRYKMRRISANIAPPKKTRKLILSDLPLKS